MAEVDDLDVDINEYNDDFESLISVLFPNTTDLPASYSSYLNEISSYGIDKLSVQPAILEDEYEKILDDTKDLAFNHYRTIIDSADCIEYVYKGVQKIDTEVDLLIDTDLPKLSDNCLSFFEEINIINKEREENLFLVQQQSTIMEFLEIPDLMNICIQRCCYTEALELKEFAEDISQQYPDLELISQINDKVQENSQVLLNILLSELCEKSSLSDTRNLVSYIRRMDIYTEKELKVLFLKCKDEFIDKEIEASMKGKTLFLKLDKMIYNTRSSLRDVLLQYTTIFLKDKQSDVVLNSWILHRINIFLSILKQYLSDITEGRFLMNILTSCMNLGKYLGNSFGIDFRSLLPPIFEKCILDIYTNNLRIATEQFPALLRKYKNLSSYEGLASYNDDEDNVGPPVILVEFPPLAMLTNRLLSNFNDLRKCWPVSLQEPLTSLLSDCLTSNFTQMRQFILSGISKPANQHLYIKFCKVAIEDFLPYILQCFASIYPESKFDIDAVSIAEPLREFNEVNYLK
eukprot:TRINITY_DN9429_c0_g1_i1.p1 TRINITY_DN9429_c0_g1~~TRINITY_DN9429_c0_g1_i1.p1  ORF type:complete len:518 (-),score=91.17 TRINITY_DN9429_c0_g1_i1:20-1573(-)